VQPSVWDPSALVDLARTVLDRCALFSKTLLCGGPKAVFRQRIVMPTDAFANSAELMKNVLRGLIESGAVKMQEASVRSSDKVSVGEKAVQQYSGDRRSNAQNDQLDHADSDHEDCECYGIIVEPMPLLLHDTPPFSRFISRAGRQLVQM